MKLILAFATILAVALAAPQGHPQHFKEEQQVVLVKETPSDNIGLDGYKFGYELSNGETRQESAQLVNVGTENEALTVSGSYSFVDPATGRTYSVTYTADENGFHPQGEHIPV